MKLADDPSLAIHPAREPCLQANSSDIQGANRDSVLGNPPNTSLAQNGNTEASQNEMGKAA
jgi:hypothetical protein